MLLNWRSQILKITTDLTYTGKIIPSQTSKYAMRNGVEHPTGSVEANRKKAKIEELSNNNSDRSEA